MSLYKGLQEECTMWQPNRTEDGAGGFKVEWTESSPFMAAIMLTATVSTRTAEREGTTDTYSITTDDKILKYHDVVRRLSDGKFFRVISEPVVTPSRAGFKFAKVTAELWEATT